MNTELPAFLRPIDAAAVVKMSSPTIISHAQAGYLAYWRFSESSKGIRLETQDVVRFYQLKNVTVQPMPEFKGEVLSSQLGAMVNVSQGTLTRAVDAKALTGRKVGNIYVFDLEDLYVDARTPCKYPQKLYPYPPAPTAERPKHPISELAVMKGQLVDAMRRLDILEKWRTSVENRTRPLATHALVEQPRLV